MRFSGQPLALAILALHCGGQAERTVDSTTTVSVCSQYCSLRSLCGFQNADCADDCAWVEGRFRELYPECYADASSNLKCLLAAPERVSCDGNSAELTLDGCPRLSRDTTCSLAFANGSDGGFRLAPQQNDDCSPAPAEQAIGDIEAPTNPSQVVADGLQTFLGDMGRSDLISVPEETVHCEIRGTVRETDLTVSVLIRSAAASFAANGNIKFGSGVLDVAWQGLESLPEEPCPISIRDGLQNVSRSYLWGDFTCTSLSDRAASPLRCAATGTLLVENCHLLDH